MYRTFRFTHPDFIRTETSIGLSVDNTGRIDTVSENEAVRQSLLILLTTMPGERVMHPAYGCNLHRLLFAPNDATTHGLVIHYVSIAIKRWEPRVEIIQLDATSDESNPGVLNIYLEYKVKRTTQRDILMIPFNLNSGVG